MNTKLFRQGVFGAASVFCLALAIGACMASTDEELGTRPEPEDPAVAMDPLLRSDQEKNAAKYDESMQSPSGQIESPFGPKPPPNGGFDAGPGVGDCSWLMPYCRATAATPNATPYGWPLPPADTKCYCKCTTHEDCSGMPTAKECGTLFDIYAPGTGTWKWTFPDGWPTACRFPGQPLAPTVP